MAFAEREDTAMASTGHDREALALTSRKEVDGQLSLPLSDIKWEGQYCKDRHGLT